jgi:hypothetical protein
MRPTPSLRRAATTALAMAGILTLTACGTPQDAQLETEKLLNAKRVDVLKKGKDSLTNPREVIFWVGFKTTADMPCMETWLQQQQYTVLFKIQRPEEAFPEVIEFSKTLVPTVDTMNVLVSELIPAATACKGQYKEWEAPVVP